MATTLSMPLPAHFSLPHAVCSYGYFILAPNRWAAGILRRPLRDLDGGVVPVSIVQAGRVLRIRCRRRVERRHHDRLRAQVARMLRLDEDLSHWRRLHPAADRARFHRTFRSPTLFEDIVKTITGCNVAWPNTVRMNRLLCEHAGADGDFPTPAELAAWTPARLRRLCKVGYRAQRIIRLARDVDSGRLDLNSLEDPVRATEDLYEALVAIHGIGPYAAHNVLQLLGRYDRLPVDTETLRHFRQLHNLEGDVKRITAAAQRHYRRFAPYQFLAYWFELWRDYERRFGPAHLWTEEHHTRFTAHELRERPDNAAARMKKATGPRV